MDLESKKRLRKIYPLIIDKYETLIPDIGDGDIITKMNNVIQGLNGIGHLSSDVVGKWNEVMKWVLNDGLTEEADRKINEMVDSGAFDQIINESQAGWKADVDTELSQKAKKKGFNIEDYGAKPNDPTFDCLPKINNAILAAFNAGGGVVEIPANVYYVKPQNDKRIELKPNVSIVGCGSQSVIKVMDNVGDYYTVFGQLNNNPSERLVNVFVKGFTVDQNSDSNTSCNISMSNPNPYHRQQVFSFFNFENCHIKEVNLYTCAMNAITFNGFQNDSKNCSVKDCYIHFKLGKSSDPWYDNTCIYFECHSYIGIGNIIESQTTSQGRGGIELHNGIGIVTDNLIKKMENAIHIVSHIVTPCRLKVVDNVLNECQTGVMIWDGGVPPEFIEVSNNDIYITERSNNNANTIYAGICFSSQVFDSPVKNVKVKNNTVTFNLTESITVNYDFSGGIVFAQNVSLSDFQITGNVVINSPSQGIHFGSYTSNTQLVRNVKIKDNTVINSSQNLNTPETRKNGYSVAGSLEMFIIEDNNTVDNFSVKRTSKNVKVITTKNALNSYYANNTSIDVNGLSISNSISPFLRSGSDLTITSPSNIRFKLTIDDSGVLSAIQL